MNTLQHLEEGYILLHKMKIAGQEGSAEYEQLLDLLDQHWRNASTSEKELSGLMLMSLRYLRGEGINRKGRQEALDIQETLRNYRRGDYAAVIRDLLKKDICELQDSAFYMQARCWQRLGCFEIANLLFKNRLAVDENWTYVSVRRLKKLIDPFERAYNIWFYEDDSPITFNEVLDAGEEGNFQPISSSVYEPSKQWHIERIAFLMEFPHLTPIDIDLGTPDPDEGFWFDQVATPVTDGNHRLAAAILREDEAIPAFVTGDRNYIQQVLGTTEGLKHVGE